MKIMMISDQNDHTTLGLKIKSALLDWLKKSSYQYIAYDIEQDELHHCIGCFNCWIKTPGICSFDDLGRKLNQSYIESDLTIILSPVKYGCYSTIIKRFWDRNLPTVSPFFKKIKGEVHHRPRYDKYPQLIMIGYGTELNNSEMATFKTLNDANAINFQIDAANTYFCNNTETFPTIINSINHYIDSLKEQIK